MADAAGAAAALGGDEGLLDAPGGAHATSLLVAYWAAASLVAGCLFLCCYALLPPVRQTPGWQLMRSSVCELFESALWAGVGLVAPPYARTLWPPLLACDIAANGLRLTMYLDLLVVYRDPFSPRLYRPLYYVAVAACALGGTVSAVLCGASPHAPPSLLPAAPPASELLVWDLVYLPCAALYTVGGVLYLLLRVLLLQRHDSAFAHVSDLGRLRAVRHAGAYLGMYGALLGALVLVYTLNERAAAAGCGRAAAGGAAAGGGAGAAGARGGAAAAGSAALGAAAEALASARDGAAARAGCARLRHALVALTAGRPALAFLGWAYINAVPCLLLRGCAGARARARRAGGGALALSTLLLRGGGARRGGAGAKGGGAGGGVADADGCAGAGAGACAGAAGLRQPLLPPPQRGAGGSGAAADSAAAAAHAPPPHAPRAPVPPAELSAAPAFGGVDLEAAGGGGRAALRASVPQLAAAWPPRPNAPPGGGSAAPSPTEAQTPSPPPTPLREPAAAGPASPPGVVQQLRYELVYEAMAGIGDAAKLALEHANARRGGGGAQHGGGGGGGGGYTPAGARTPPRAADAGGADGGGGLGGYLGWALQGAAAAVGGGRARSHSGADEWSGRWSDAGGGGGGGGGPCAADDGGGAAAAAGAADSAAAPPRGRVRHYARADFEAIRQACRIDAAEYARAFPQAPEALLGPDWQRRLAESVSEGASGCFFYRVRHADGSDTGFLVKQITPAEKRALLRMLPAYRAHVCARMGRTLLHYYGCHSVRLRWVASVRVYFVVMRNFVPVAPHLVFDLKGATANRRALASSSLFRLDSSGGRAAAADGAGAAGAGEGRGVGGCGGAHAAPPGGSAEPSALLASAASVAPFFRRSERTRMGRSKYGTLRDWEWLDVAMAAELPAEEQLRLAETLEADCAMLAGQRAIDYSLLVAVARVADAARPRAAAAGAAGGGGGGGALSGAHYGGGGGGCSAPPTISATRRLPAAPGGPSSAAASAALDPIEKARVLRRLQAAGGIISRDRQKVYFVGMIDALSTHSVGWVLQAQALRALYTAACRPAAADGITAMAPHAYAERLVAFVVSEVLAPESEPARALRARHARAVARWAHLWARRRHGLLRERIEAERADLTMRIAELEGLILERLHGGGGGGGGSGGGAPPGAIASLHAAAPGGGGGSAGGGGPSAMAHHATPALQHRTGSG